VTGRYALQAAVQMLVLSELEMAAFDPKQTLEIANDDRSTEEKKLKEEAC